MKITNDEISFLQFFNFNLIFIVKVLKNVVDDLVQFKIKSIEIFGSDNFSENSYSPLIHRVNFILQFFSLRSRKNSINIKFHCSYS